MVVKYYLLMLLLVITLINDILNQKIKNLVVLPFLLCGLLLNGYLTGLIGFIDSFLAGVLPILVLGVFFIMNMLGAGDIKLFSAIGAIMGTTFVIKTVLYSALAGGLIALMILLFRQNTQERFRYVHAYFKHCLLTRSFPPYSTFIGANDESQFPYVYAIAAGSMITLLLI